MLPSPLLSTYPGSMQPQISEHDKISNVSCALRKMGQFLISKDLSRGRFRRSNELDRGLAERGVHVCVSVCALHDKAAIGSISLVEVDKLSGAPPAVGCPEELSGSVLEPRRCWEREFTDALRNLAIDKVGSGDDRAGRESNGARDSAGRVGAKLPGPVGSQNEGSTRCCRDQGGDTQQQHSQEAHH
eukprot:TRINITY_DN299_c0_g1_i1.p1 TRINITY_DN299_c0_g1~~TRINITY_DN299_c0_g1_i1.p1  ORF type:complete len:187 (-),score=9.41 TRINITY_DN299_c0_g1_i1:139-699(-)